MIKVIAVSCALVALISVGCSTRGFRPPAEPWEEFVRQDRKVSFDEVKRELLSCGYAPLSYGSLPDKSTDNDRAARIECMFAKGFFSATDGAGYVRIQSVVQDYQPVQTHPFAQGIVELIPKWFQMLKPQH